MNKYIVYILVIIVIVGLISIACCDKDLTEEELKQQKEEINETAWTWLLEKQERTRQIQSGEIEVKRGCIGGEECFAAHDEHFLSATETYMILPVYKNKESGKITEWFVSFSDKEGNCELTARYDNYGMSNIFYLFLHPNKIWHTIKKIIYSTPNSFNFNCYFDYFNEEIVNEIKESDENVEEVKFERIIETKHTYLGDYDYYILIIYKDGTQEHIEYFEYYKMNIE